jgi:hypothetical protein
MAERRRVKRKYLLFYTRIFDGGTDALLGHLIDITPQGAMLISEKPLPVDADIRLRMELSPDVAAVPYVEFDAHSIWCRPDVNPLFYNTGFELRGVTAEQAEIIEHIIEAYGFRDN